METLAPPTAVARQRLRLAGWLLALSPVAFAVVTVAWGATFADTGVDNYTLLTPEQLADIRLGWIVLWAVYAAAVLVGAVAMAALNQALRGTPARALANASQVAVAVSVASMLTGLVLRYAVLGFTEARLELNSLHDAAYWTSLLAIWSAAVAVALTGIGLRTSGVLRRTGLVVALIAAGYVLVDVVLTRGELPPFVIALLWLPLGIGLLRRRVPSLT